MKNTLIQTVQAQPLRGSNYKYLNTEFAIAVEQNGELYFEVQSDNQNFYLKFLSKEIKLIKDKKEIRKDFNDLIAYGKFIEEGKPVYQPIDTSKKILLNVPNTGSGLFLNIFVFEDGGVGQTLLNERISKCYSLYYDKGNIIDILLMATKEKDNILKPTSFARKYNWI